MGVGDAEVVSVLVGNEEVGQQGNHVRGGKVLAGGEVGAAFDEEGVEAGEVDHLRPEQELVLVVRLWSPCRRPRGQTS